MGFFNKLLGDRFSIDNDDIDSRYRLNENDDYNPFLEKHRNQGNNRDRKPDRNPIIKDGRSVKDIDTLNPEKHHHDPLKAPTHEPHKSESDIFSTNVTTSEPTATKPVWETKVTSDDRIVTTSKPVQKPVSTSSSRQYNYSASNPNSVTTEEIEEHKKKKKKNNGPLIFFLVLFFMLPSIIQVFAKSNEPPKKAAITTPSLAATTPLTKEEIKEKAIFYSRAVGSRYMLALYIRNTNYATPVEDIVAALDECEAEGSINFNENCLNSLKMQIAAGYTTPEEQRQRLEDMHYTKSQIEYAFAHIDDEVEETDETSELEETSEPSESEEEN